MSFKDYLKAMLRDFFIITTLVNFAMFFLGTKYLNEATFGYDAYLMPPLYGFFGILPALILYSKKELSIKQLAIRKIFQFIALEIILISLTFGGEPEILKHMDMVISFAISVLVVYVLVSVFIWIIDSKSAKDIMKDLKEYQDIHNT